MQNSQPAYKQANKAVHENKFLYCYIKFQDFAP